MAGRGYRPPPPAPPGISGPEVLLLLAAVLWLVVGGVWAVRAGGGLAAIILVLLPPAVIALAVVLSRAVRLLGAEGARLAWAVAELQGLASPARTAPPPPPQAAEPPPVAAPAQPAAPADPEPQLALAAPEAEAPLARDDLVRALNFPEDEQDAEGIAALRRALGNREVRQLIHAAQDALTLLSQDGIYMDDLAPDQARPEIWRRFAQGERGHPVAQLGGLDDRAALGAVMRRMREDMIFRDTAHHFLRLFDRILSHFEPEAADEELIALSGTRTARAFILIGRAAGVFG
ncbi:MAG: hypothetical protein H3C51_01100 [Rubellimicrobium sp.]|nr:hypothetical protein [Rubellimicrobium sp.]